MLDETLVALGGEEVIAGVGGGAEGLAGGEVVDLASDSLVSELPGRRLWCDRSLEEGMVSPTHENKPTERVTMIAVSEFKGTQCSGSS